MSKGLLGIDDTEVREIIARACGWVEGDYDGGFAGPCYGWYHPGGGRPTGLPDYLTDYSTLREMWALCGKEGLLPCVNQKYVAVCPTPLSRGNQRSMEYPGTDFLPNFARCLALVLRDIGVAEGGA